jgi:hypothetical protein
MNTTKNAQSRTLQLHFPALEKIQQGLGKAESTDDFVGKQEVLARLFAKTLEQMLEAEWTALGYEKYEAKRLNSGNSRNGKRSAIALACFTEMGSKVSSTWIKLMKGKKTGAIRKSI